LSRLFGISAGEYASQSHDGKPAGLFAQKSKAIRAGRTGSTIRDKPGEKTAVPLGDLAAKAAQEGNYCKTNRIDPFWGYHFRILTGQGDKAPGVERAISANGDMSGRVCHSSPSLPNMAASGVMTFVVNQAAVVYEKDLGPETENLAAGNNGIAQVLMKHGRVVNIGG